jgi:hypothetical protein
MYTESYKIINISSGSNNEVGNSKVEDNTTYKSNEFININVILARTNSQQLSQVQPLIQPIQPLIQLPLSTTSLANQPLIQSSIRPSLSAALISIRPTQAHKPTLKQASQNRRTSEKEEKKKAKLAKNAKTTKTTQLKDFKLPF